MVAMKRSILVLLLILLPVFAQADLIPFVLPWNDVSENVTNLSRFQHAPAGARGWVQVSADGHYRAGGERIRFFGVNIGADACFPSHGDAAQIAPRMRRLGLNVVRFHHLDNTWTGSVIDYSTGGSRTLHAGNLDRLHFFQHQLKEAGIYTNMNLVCSRRFSAADGLPAEVEALEWKVQHGLGFFREDALQLQKEYAAQLLGAENPYTGVSMLEDPAVAFVEVNNENGLFQLWFAGDLEGMGPVLLQPLQDQWNAWLQAKYANTAELETAWGAIREELGPNILTNGDFSAGTNSWNLEQHQGAQATATTGNFHEGATAVRIDVNALGSAGWHVQFNQRDLAVEEGQVYTMSFWARSGETRTISVTEMQAYDPWQRLDYGENIELNPEWQFFERSFVSTVDDDNVRINFGNLGSELGTVFLAGVQLRPGGEIGTLSEGVSLEGGNVPLISSAGGGTIGSERDWIQFLWETEYAYWAEMERYLKQDLGYKGLVWGTIISNSPPNIQSVYDAIDSHRYWNHPNFPGDGWDPVNWTVSNAPMVNDPEGGTLPELAMQRVAGKPFNVTEYQHSSPNTYGSDGPLLLAAYASLQDWDGLYLFHYGSSRSNYDRGYFDGFFDIDQHPAKLVNAALASFMFRRFQIQAAAETRQIPFDVGKEREILQWSGGAWSVADGNHLDIPWQEAYTRRVELVPSAEVEEPATIELDPVVESSNGHIVWDQSIPGHGVVTVNTDYAKAVIGFDAGRSFDLGRVMVDPGVTEQAWSTIVCVAVAGDFGSGGFPAGLSAIVAATGNTENTGMGWKDGSKTSVGNNWGGPPTLVERVPFTLLMPVAPERIRAWTLDERGDRRNEVAPSALGGGSLLAFGDNESNGSLWYELEVEPLAAPHALEAPLLSYPEADRIAVKFSNGEESGATHFILETSTDEQTWSRLEREPIPPHETQVEVVGLAEDTNYWMRVIGVNNMGESASPVVSFRTQRTYETWAADVFSPVELSDQAMAGRKADPDRDFICNELESALGLDPRSPSPVPVPIPSVGLDESLRWAIPDKAGSEAAAHLAISFSGNLVDWHSAELRLSPEGEMRFASAVPDGPEFADLFKTLFWRWMLVED